MSINITIFGIRTIIIPKINKQDVQHIFFNCWQTPTATTETICVIDNRDTRLKRYSDWVMSQGEDREYTMWQEGDNINDPESYTKIEVYNSAKEHIEDLQGWLESAITAGYEVFVEME